MRFPFNGRRQLERKLRRVRSDLARAREELRVAAQQSLAMSEDDDEARIRMLVSENRLEEKQWDKSHRHAEVMHQSVEKARRRVADLERSEEEIVETLVQRAARTIPDRPVP